jgi:hypothetical protein
MTPFGHASVSLTEKTRQCLLENQNRLMYLLELSNTAF